MIDGETIFDSRNYDVEDELAFEDIFDDSKENKSYILVGNIRRWDGPSKYVPEKVFDSVCEAIRHTFLRSDFYFKVVSHKRGRLFVEVHHHDDVNEYEIRQLTDRGYELYNNWWSIEEIEKRDYATKNARFELQQ